MTDKPFKFCILLCCKQCMWGLWTIKYDWQAIQVFVCVPSIACTTVNEKLTVCNILLITHDLLKMMSNICREVDEVREERIRRRECHRLREEKRLMKQDIQGL